MKKRAVASRWERRLSFLREAQFSGVAAPGQMIRDANGEICSLLLRRIFQVSAGQVGIVQIPSLCHSGQNWPFGRYYNFARHSSI